MNMVNGSNDGTGRLTENPATDRKIRSFTSLENGWLFGEGVAPSVETIAIALKLNETAIGKGFASTDAFPGPRGQVAVAVYYSDYYLEITIEADQTVTWLLERSDNEIERLEGLTNDDVARHLDDLREALWRQYDSSVDYTTIQGSRDSRVGPFPTHRGTVEASLSSPRIVSSGVATKSAITSGGTTRTSRLSRLSSGGSPSTYYRLTAA